MTKARDIANLVDANGDIVAGALDNVPAGDVVNDTTPQLGGDLDVNGNAITGSTVSINGSTGEFMITATENGPVALRYDNNLKLTTKSDGVDITGELQADSLDIDGDGDITGNLTLGGNLNLGDNDKAIFGAGSDLQIYNDATHSRIKEVGTGNLIISADNFAVNNAADSQTIIDADSGGAVRLRYAGNTKLATTSTGVSVTGTLAATAVTGDGSGLTNVAGPSNLSSSFVTTTNSGGTAADFISSTGTTMVVRRTYNNSGNFISFIASAGQCGRIYTNGDSYTAYATSSDYRLKNNITSNWEGTAKLKQLNPVRFNFNTQPNETISGFLAHEVQEVVPDAVIGEKDAVDSDGNPAYQSIDHSRLVPLLVKTVQELEARIAVLEAG